MSLISKRKHAVINITKTVLKLNTDDVTEKDVMLLKETFKKHLDDGMSPSDIKALYSIEYSDFGMFIKKCLNMKLLTTKEAVNNYYKKTGKSKSDEKELYYKACSFSFDPYSISSVPGYDRLLTLGIYHPANNPSGVCRDHMVSVAFGWRNNISPEIISHPCNCQFISNLENIIKNDRSVLTIDQLEKRIHTYDMSPVKNEAKSLPKTSEHKRKIGITNSQYMLITDGEHNIRVLKSSPIPTGYRRGFVRKK